MFIVLGDLQSTDTISNDHVNLIQNTTVATFEDDNVIGDKRSAEKNQTETAEPSGFLQLNNSVFDNDSQPMSKPVVDVNYTTNKNLGLMDNIDVSYMTWLMYQNKSIDIHLTGVTQTNYEANTEGSITGVTDFTTEFNMDEVANNVFNTIVNAQTTMQSGLQDITTGRNI